MSRIAISSPPVDLSGLHDAFKGGDLSIISSMIVDVDVSGKEEIMKNLYGVSKELRDSAQEESSRQAEWLYNRSSELVPKLTGNLASSEFIHSDEGDGVIGFTVGYDAIGVQYAWYVHEIPAEHYTTPGTRHHFLSDPAEELRSEFPDVMRRSLKQALAKSATLRRVSSTGPRLVKKVR